MVFFNKKTMLFREQTLSPWVSVSKSHAINLPMRAEDIGVIYTFDQYLLIQLFISIF